MSGQPKAPFWLAVWAVIFGLVGLAAWRAGMLEQFGLGRPGAAGQGPVAAKPAAGGGGGAADDAGGNAGGEAGPEAADTSVPTTVKEYTFKPQEKLPPVKGTSGYKPLQDDTVRFALNVWAGWSPIIYANNGFKAGKVKNPRFTLLSGVAAVGGPAGMNMAQSVLYVTDVSTGVTVAYGIPWSSQVADTPGMAELMPLDIAKPRGGGAKVR